MTIIYLVRHGESEENVRNIIQGQSNTPLTAKGEAQAMAAAEALKDVAFDRVFSSDMVRARRTAELIALERALAVNATEQLRETNMGAWEGRPATEYVEQNRDLIDRYETLGEEEKWEFKTSPDAESDGDVNRRFMAFLREVAAAHAGETVLFVTHGGVMRTTLVRLGYGTHAELPVGSVANTAFIKIRADGDEFHVDETNGITKRP